MGKTNDSFDRHYALAKAYYDKNGNLDISSGYEVDGVKLGAWISYMRRHAKEGRVSDEKIELLNKIGMVWQKNRSFEDEFAYALNYYKKNNTLDGNKRIAKWLDNIKLYARYNRLTDEKIEMLKAIGIDLKTKKPFKGKRSSVMFELYKEYVAEKGIYINTREIYKGKELGMWVASLRGAKKNNTLSDEKIRALEDVGIIWDIMSYNWDGIYELCRKHISEGKPINMKTQLEGFCIGAWFLIQKTSYLNNTDLSDLQKDKMEALIRLLEKEKILKKGVV